jgi:hypothetical protein
MASVEVESDQVTVRIEGMDRSWTTKSGFKRGRTTSVHAGSPRTSEGDNAVRTPTTKTTAIRTTPRPNRASDQRN